MAVRGKRSATKYAIRKVAGFEEELSSAQRMLREAIEQQKMGLDGLMAVRYQLTGVFSRILRLQEQIDDAFGGQLFDQDLPLLSPANVRRCNAFMLSQGKALRLMFRAIEAWVLTCGVRWKCSSKTCAAHNCPTQGKRARSRTSVATN
jgi:hypothetical protein